jgi:phytoene dehydrogenase-like protein
VKQYDAIFIGSGHNALIAAAYLARAGWSVLVLERNDRPGGLVRTEDLTVPGFRHDVYSSSHPLFVTSQAYADLGPELAERGLRYLNTDKPTGVSLPDGQSAVFCRDLEANVAEADRLFPGDGQAFREMMEEFNAHAGDVFPLFGLDFASPEAAPFLRRLMVNAEGSGPSPFASEFMLPARDVLEARFRSRVFRALAAPWVLHLGRTPDGANSGFWVPLTLAAIMGGGMATAEGGSESLARALTRLIEDHGGVIRTGGAVERILVQDGKAVGVRVAGGEEYRAGRAVVASTNPDRPPRPERAGGHPGMPRHQPRRSRPLQPQPGSGRPLRRLARPGAELCLPAAAEPAQPPHGRAQRLHAGRRHLARPRGERRLGVYRGEAVVEGVGLARRKGHKGQQGLQGHQEKSFFSWRPCCPCCPFRPLLVFTGSSSRRSRRWH